LLENPLSDAILRGEFKSGDTVYADVQDGKIILSLYLGSQPKDEEKKEEKEEAKEAEEKEEGKE